MSQDALLIAVVGLTGAGKTTFINLASGSELRVGHDLESCTSEVQLSKPFTLDGKRIILIDTPGFDDTSKTDVETLQETAKKLAELYTDGRKLTGIIYLNRITDVRMGGVATKHIRMFRELCGEDSLRNVIITTGWWSIAERTPNDKERAVERERQLASDNKFFKRALDKQAQLVRYYDTRDSAYGIIRKLIPLPPTTLRIQTELVDEKKKLSETGAGKELNKELEEEIARYKKEVDDLKHEISQVRAEHKAEIKEMMEEQQRARKQWEEAQREKDRLNSVRFDNEMKQLRNSLSSMEKENRQLGAKLGAAEAARKRAEQANKPKSGC